MRPLRVYVISALYALILTGIFVGLVRTFPILRLIDLQGRDFFFRFRHERISEITEKAKEIVLVTLDNETLTNINTRWPFPRLLYAQALRQMTPYKPKVIGFDLIFSGDDFRAGSDEDFSAAIAEAGNVVMASHQTDAGEVGPLLALKESAVGTGLVDKLRDSDYVLRRSFLARKIDKNLHPSWELEIFSAAFPNASTWQFPLGRDVPINYRVRHEEFKLIPFVKVLEGRVRADELRDKIVLIGATAEAFHDIHATPLGAMSGLAVNANSILMMMQRDFFVHAPGWIKLLLFFLSFWVAILIIATSAISVGITLIALLSTLYVVATYALFRSEVILDPWLLILSTVIVFIGAVIARQAQLFLDNRRLQDMSSKDGLTGFYNRRFLDLKLAAEFNRIISHKGFFNSSDDISVVMIDLDNFKMVNDSFGHAEGDKVLHTMAATIRGSVRKSEIICRFGGDEFCVVLPGTDMNHAGQFANKIRNLIASHPDLEFPLPDGSKTIRVTGSIGVASAKAASAHDHSALMKAADNALYRAKEGGRNKVCLFDPKIDQAR